MRLLLHRAHVIYIYYAMRVYRGRAFNIECCRTAAERTAAAFLMLYYLLSLRTDLRFLKRLAKRQRPEEKLFFCLINIPSHGMYMYTQRANSKQIFSSFYSFASLHFADCEIRNRR
jgi:hypothetical protein